MWAAPFSGLALVNEGSRLGTAVVHTLIALFS